MNQTQIGVNWFEVTTSDKWMIIVAYNHDALDKDVMYHKDIIRIDQVTSVELIGPMNKQLRMVSGGIKERVYESIDSENILELMKLISEGIGAETSETAEEEPSA